ncbi:MAG: hypothetical protein ACKPHU_15300, partial [Planctomycetaceae bacterium]
ARDRHCRRGTENVRHLSWWIAREGEAPAEPNQHRDGGDFTGALSALFAHGLPSGGSWLTHRSHTSHLSHNIPHHATATAIIGTYDVIGRGWFG